MEDDPRVLRSDHNTHSIPLIKLILDLAETDPGRDDTVRRPIQSMRDGSGSSVEFKITHIRLELLVHRLGETLLLVIAQRPNSKRQNGCAVQHPLEEI